MRRAGLDGTAVGLETGTLLEIAARLGHDGRWTAELLAWVEAGMLEGIDDRRPARGQDDGD